MDSPTDRSVYTFLVNADSCKSPYRLQHMLGTTVRSHLGSTCWCWKPHITFWAQWAPVPFELHGTEARTLQKALLYGRADV